MSMLAEPRRKVKYGIDPRGETWSRDENKFGQKLMEKMGWSKGKGLGANEDGETEHVKVRVKNDTKGVGCSVKHADNWIAHQDDFNALLSSLNETSSPAAAADGVSEQQYTLQNLADKSKASKARVHYMKFAKGKDLSAKNSNELDCIFGRRKSAPTTPTTQSQVNSVDNSSDESSTDACGKKLNKSEHGLITISSGQSVQEYFAQKMAQMKSKHRDAAGNVCTAQENGEESESELSARVGFGFSTSEKVMAEDYQHTQTVGFGFGFTEAVPENKEDEDEPSAKKKKSKKSKKVKEQVENFEEERPASESEICEARELLTETKEKKKKLKKKNKEKEDPCEDDADKKAKKKCKKSKDEKHAQKVQDKEDKKMKRKKAKEAMQVDEDEESDDKTAKKKCKKSKEERIEHEDDERAAKKKCKKSKDEKNEQQEEEGAKKAKKKIKNSKVGKEDEQDIVNKDASRKRKCDDESEDNLYETPVFKASNFDKIVGYNDGENWQSFKKARKSKRL